MDTYNGWMMEEAKIKYIKPTYTKNDLSEDPRLHGKMTWRMTREKWKLLTGDKQRRTEMDGGEQLRKC
jgi:hypothetical protein